MRLILMLYFSLIFFVESHAALVTRVIDGDTMVVDNLTKIRLYGIDCPEREQSGETFATESTVFLALGQFVFLDEQYQDRFGRTVAIVRLDSGLTVQELLLQRGAAWVAPRYCKLPVCSEWELIEKNARLSSVGIWAEPHPIPPWKWRKRVK